MPLHGREIVWRVKGGPGWSERAGPWRWLVVAPRPGSRASRMEWERWQSREATAERVAPGRRAHGQCREPPVWIRWAAGEHANGAAACHHAGVEPPRLPVEN